MSWAKESAKVGLADLTLGEAARGAMFLPVFQNMPDPLHQEIDIKGPDDVPMVSVSTFIHTCIITARCVYSTQYFKCIECRECRHCRFIFILDQQGRAWWQ